VYCYPCREGELEVDANQFRVPLGGALLVAGRLQPLIDEFPEGHAGPRMALLVDLRLKTGQSLLGGLLGGGGLAEAPVLAGEGVDSRVDDGAPLAARSLLHVAPGATRRRRHGDEDRRRSSPRPSPEKHEAPGSNTKTAGQAACPRQDSNLRQPAFREDRHGSPRVMPGTSLDVR
jgi:hypothetical protein